jgi:hypothetical protein
MAALAWSQLLDRLAEAGLDVTTAPAPKGWARCPNGGAHSNGDRNPSLRIDVESGMAKCMTHECVEPPNLNGLARLMGVSIFDDVDFNTTASRVPGSGHGGGAAPSTSSPDPKRVPTLNELAHRYRVPVEVLNFLGITPRAGGWGYPIDDADGGSVTRIKAVPGLRPKYSWTPSGKAKAKDYVYGISRLPINTVNAFIAAGEPDCWVLQHTGYPAVSFLAGEGTLPSPVALRKLRERAPGLQGITIPYDYDSAGKAGAQKLASLAVGVGLCATIVEMPAYLPDGGDVADLWVYCGADVQPFREVFDGLVLQGERFEPAAPKVESRDESNFTITMPVPGGEVVFSFEHLTRGPHKLDADLTIRCALPGVDAEPFFLAMNTYSSSGRDDLRRQLEGMYGDHGWQALINKATTRLRLAYQSIDHSVDLFDVVRKPKRYRVAGMLPDGEPSMLFGDGGNFKTYQSLLMALCISLGLPYMGRETIKGRVLYIDAEANEDAMIDRVTKLVEGHNLDWARGMIRYWPSRGRSLPDMAEAIRDLVIREGIDFIILDSVALLCGGEPEKADIAAHYFNALAYIGKTSLSIAHVTKESDQKKPFGSAFWHNSARTTWNVQRAQEEDASVINVGVYNRKQNDGPLAAPFALRVGFDGLEGPVTVNLADVQETRELARGTSVKARIRFALRKVYLTEGEICDALEIDEDDRKARGQVRTRLYEMQRDGLARRDPLDGKWGLISKRDDDEQRAG